MPLVTLFVTVLAWLDLPPSIQERLARAGVDAARFEDFIAGEERRTRERVREGDLDAAIYFALQSAAITKEPPIEPALSAKAFVEGGEQVPDAVRRRLDALVASLPGAAPASRLAYIREILDHERAAGADPRATLLSHYARAMRFLYEKEFVAARRDQSAAAIAELYRTRALSTDTAIEAGYLVHLGLATIGAAEPSRRIRRVLVVGPGLDLAPRTGLVEHGGPASPQPFAIADSLVSLGLARLDDVSIVCADVNPRVVGHLRALKGRAVTLGVASSLADRAGLQMDEGYRQYLARLGERIGSRDVAAAGIVVRGDVSRIVDAERLDIVTERLEGGSFDLIVATNVLPYLDDRALTLAMANIAAMLAPGGLFVHNEPRPLVGEVGVEVGLPLIHARSAVLATVTGASTPLYDGVFVHSKPKL